MDRLTRVFVFLAAIGLVIAIYHGYDEFTAYAGAGSNACDVFTQLNPFLSCTTVFASGYATLPPHDPSGLPLYVLGLVWFPLMLALGVWYGKEGGLNGEVMVPVLKVGNLFTLYLWYLELGVIHALCPICLGMYLENYALTGLALGALLDSG